MKEVARGILGRLGFFGLLLVVGRCMMLYLLSVHSLNIYNISVLCCAVLHCALPRASESAEKKICGGLLGCLLCAAYPY